MSMSTKPDTMASASIWSWKLEPASPAQLYEQEFWYNASDNVVVEVELSDEVDLARRAETASRLLKDLEEFKEEEPYLDWQEDRIDLPIFDDLPTPPLMNNLDLVGIKPAPSINSLDMVALKPSPLDNGMKTHMVNNGIELVGMKPQSQNLLQLNPIQYQLPANPNSLVMEQTPVLMQEYDYTTVTAAHDTLTPPESPRDVEMVFTMLQEMQPHELDELVRMRVESLVESPETCVESTRSSLHEESDSVGSPSSESGFSDPEWNLPSCSDLKTPKRRRMTKPYSRAAPEEKRLRKKEQNKNAATRYRLKKKQEIEEILGEEKQLQQQNEQLKSELTEVGREIKYLKNLMRDMFKAKGLIK